MKTVFAIMGLSLVLAVNAQPPGYSQAITLADGAELVVTRTDGSKLSVPKSEEQDAFAKSRVSADGRYVGWLEMRSNMGASYPLPVGFDVLDTSNRIQRFGGDFGMVFGWCFAENGNTVTYTYSFPRGATPIGFDMRRLKDGKLLRRVQVGPAKPDEDNDRLVRSSAPSWALCAWNSVRSE